MTAKDFHKMKTDELVVKLGELKESLFKLRFRHATGNSSPLEMVTCRKDIARVKTILREREIKDKNIAKPTVKKANKPTAVKSAKRG